MSKQKIIVVGNGMVGHKFIDTLIQSEQNNIEVVTFSEEPRLAYDRVQLTSYFTGKTVDDLSLTSEGYYQSNGIKYLLNEKVSQVNPDAKQIVTSSGRVESYDKLVLATGSTRLCHQFPVTKKSSAMSTEPSKIWTKSNVQVKKAKLVW